MSASVYNTVLLEIMWQIWIGFIASKGKLKNFHPRKAAFIQELGDLVGYISKILGNYFYARDSLKGGH